jgi:phosphotransferase system enzyme I (PtsI)
MLYRGIPAAAGIAIGPALIFDPTELKVDRTYVRKSDVPEQVERFRLAVEQAKQSIRQMKEEVLEQIGEEHGKIFDAHLLILDDRMIMEHTLEEITKHQKSAGFAFDDAIQDVTKKLASVKNEYLRDRIGDLHDVRDRVLSAIYEAKRATLADLTEPVVIVAHELTPSDTAQMKKELILGVVTETGGKTSHSAIIARALEIPSVIGIANATHLVPAGAQLVVNGSTGEVIVNPEKKLLRRFQMEKRRFTSQEKQLLKFVDRPSLTQDGREVRLMANIELPFEIETALHHGARGVGLFRTEFLYVTRNDLPAEEEQYDDYAMVAQKMAPNPVVIRTFDLGGDKFIHNVEKLDEMNPFLGWRSIRISLDREDVFRVQLRAILRASEHRNVKVMFPMISSLEELRRAKAILAEEQARLKDQGVPCDPQIKVGAMIEVPSAAIIAEHIARECAFLSIGTNDLVQYTLAVDRGNEKIAHLFEELHPAVLGLIHQVIEAGHRANIPVAVCGEMAADPAAFLVLLGMGVDEFSMSPIIIPEMKRLLTSVTFQELYYLVNTILKQKTAHDIKQCIVDRLKDKFEMLPFYYEDRLMGQPGPAGGEIIRLKT